MPRILRWKGGFAGDMIMYLMYLSGYKIANVRFLDQPLVNGRVAVNFDHIRGDMAEIEKIALEQRFRDNLDQDRLSEEISCLQDVWIKSHYYTDQFDDITTDILVNLHSLPFVMSAAIHKTDTLKYERFHPLAARIQDPDIKIKLALYNVGKDSVDTQISSAWHITVSDIISGWDRLAASLANVDICLHHSCIEFYQRWIKNNRQYFPSSTYIDMVNNHDYDWSRLDIANVERYALLVLSQKRFKILQDKK